MMSAIRFSAAVLSSGMQANSVATKRLRVVISDLTVSGGDFQKDGRWRDRLWPCCMVAESLRPHNAARLAARAHALSQRQRQGSPFHLVTPSSTAIHPKKNQRL